ncbi:hypothetical protein ACFVOO_23620 [Streptomyces rochei]|uniref:hypothetical protein n=1 Tax=Streptomyces rochei TaxID=1928 RepID=UPI0036948ABC
MDEPTNPPSPADSRPPLVAAHTRLSPIQEAWGAYARHQLHCRQCADLDGGPCLTAGQLRQVWENLTREAFRRLAGESV